MIKKCDAIELKVAAEAVVGNWYMARYIFFLTDEIEDYLLERCNPPWIIRMLRFTTNDQASCRIWLNTDLVFKSIHNYNQWQILFLALNNRRYSEISLSIVSSSKFLGLMACCVRRVKNIWNSNVCMYVQIPTSLNIGKFQKIDLTKANEAFDSVFGYYLYY